MVTTANFFNILLLDIVEKLFLYCTAGGGIHVINTSDGEDFFELKEIFHKADISYCQWNSYFSLADISVISPLL